MVDQGPFGVKCSLKAFILLLCYVVSERSGLFM